MSVAARLAVMADAVRHLGALVRSTFGAPDPREPAEIDSDLADEFDFHLKMLEREEQAAGASPDDARRLALARFGDVERVRRTCRRIALRERTMIQRLNAVLTIVLLVAVAAIGVQTVRGQRQVHAALDTIAQRLETLDRTAAAPNESIALAVEDTSDATAQRPPRQPSRRAVVPVTEENFDRTRHALVTGDDITPFETVAGRPLAVALAVYLRHPVPQIYQSSVEVDATVRRPRGDGTDETFEVSWTRWPPAVRDLSGPGAPVAAADRIELRFRLPPPLPPLPEGWVLRATAEELQSGAAALDAAIAHADDDGVDAESLARYRSEREAIRLRLRAMGLEDPEVDPGTAD